MAELRKRFFGDTRMAQEFTKDAVGLLEMVKFQMRMGGLSQLSRRVVLANGVTLMASSAFGQDEVQVFAPSITGENSATTPSSADNVSFSLWFFQDLTTIVEFNPSTETLTGKSYTVEAQPVESAGSMAGGGIIYAHGALWYTRGSVVRRLDMGSGQVQDVIDRGYDSVRPGIVATRLGMVIVTDAALAITFMDKKGQVRGAVANYASDADLVRLVNDRLFVYTYNYDSALVDRMTVIDVNTFAVVSNDVNIFAKRNTANAGKFLWFYANLAYDAAAEKIHGKWVFNDGTNSGGSLIQTTIRGTVPAQNFASGALTPVWQGVYDTSNDPQYSDRQSEAGAGDVIIPISDKGIYVVFTAGAVGTSTNIFQPEVARVRAYRSSDDAEIFRVDSSAITISDVGAARAIRSANRVWDGGNKIWSAANPSASGYAGKLARINLATKAYELLNVTTLGRWNNGGGSIAVQPKVIGDSPGKRTEIGWVLKLQEASLR